MDNRAPNKENNKECTKFAFNATVHWLIFSVPLHAKITVTMHFPCFEMANVNRNDMESWYKLKVQEIQTQSARQNMEQGYQKEEVHSKLSIL